jgi:hypothetical protein
LPPLWHWGMRRTPSLPPGRDSALRCPRRRAQRQATEPNRDRRTPHRVVAGRPQPGAVCGCAFCHGFSPRTVPAGRWPP